jgi:hypothetical protein
MSLLASPGMFDRIYAVGSQHGWLCHWLGSHGGVVLRVCLSV